MQSGVAQEEVRHVQSIAAAAPAIPAQPPPTDDPGVIVISSDDEFDSDDVCDVTTDVSSSATSAAEHGSDDVGSQEEDTSGICQISSPGSQRQSRLVRLTPMKRRRVSRKTTETQSLQTPQQILACPCVTSRGSNKRC